jgi:ADP-heptose:LPS heptosyltransferase
MPDSPNLNLRRRPLPGLLALAASAPLRLLLLPFRRRGAEDGAVTVFAAYMVGDFFMALPALKALARAARIRVLCRADCLVLLEREGITGIPFDNAFRVRPGLAAFGTTLRDALALRGRIGSVALDLDADPRSAFWLRVAGARRVISYRRAFGALFDETFMLPAGAVHQADRDLAVAEAFLRARGTHLASLDHPAGVAPDSVAPAMPPGMEAGAPQREHAPWILSVWTRKAAKNWPLENWSTFMERLRKEGVPFAVLHAPDGNTSWHAFRNGWRERVPFVEGTLEAIADRVRTSAGVVATDNFLGHMAGYYGRPVLWINLASPAAQVEPRGPRTLRVGAPDSVNPESPDVETVWGAFMALARGGDQRPGT